MDARKTAKGVGALATGGWSVATVCPPKCASTREPPGKSMIISIFLILLVFYIFIGCTILEKVTNWRVGFPVTFPVYLHPSK
jgi:hypothetical protein